MMGIGDWGLGIGDWGLGIGPNPQSPIPNPQSPIPNPQSPIPNPQSPKIYHWPCLLIYNIKILNYFFLSSINLSINSLLYFINSSFWVFKSLTAFNASCRFLSSLLLNSL